MSIEIVGNGKGRGITFGELKIGQVFIYHGLYYQKCKLCHDDSILVVELVSGTAIRYDPNNTYNSVKFVDTDIIVPVICELKIL